MEEAMSGGSYNYFCRKAHEDAVRVGEDLEHMADEVALAAKIQTDPVESQVLVEAAGYLRFLGIRAKAIGVILEKSSDFTKAVEWWKSGDWPIDEVIGAWRQIAERKGEPTDD